MNRLTNRRTTSMLAGMLIAAPSAFAAEVTSDWPFRRGLPNTSSSLSLLPACTDRRMVCVRPSCTSWPHRWHRSESGLWGYNREDRHGLNIGRSRPSFQSRNAPLHRRRPTRFEIHSAETENELTEQDRRNLRDLIACACEDKDVKEPADRARKAPSASRLAVAIADIVQNANSHKKAAALGAIFGAHGTPFGSSSRTFIEAAVAGAVAASSVALLDDRKIGIGLDEFLTKDV
jgi:hypothetical protein